jgi:hypothetical protein
VFLLISFFWFIVIYFFVSFLRSCPDQAPMMKQSLCDLQEAGSTSSSVQRFPDGPSGSDGNWWLSGPSGLEYLGQDVLRSQMERAFCLLPWTFATGDGLLGFVRFSSLLFFVSACCYLSLPFFYFFYFFFLFILPLFLVVSFAVSSCYPFFPFLDAIWGQLR